MINNHVHTLESASDTKEIVYKLRQCELHAINAIKYCE